MAFDMAINQRLTRKHLEPVKLFLDLKNPRLFGENDYAYHQTDTPAGDPRAQEYTRQYIVKKHNIQPLVDSIKEIGFLKMDRMVVREFEPEKYVVIEGNRRLTAIKTILGDYKRRIIELQDHVAKSLQKIEVLVVEGNDDSNTDTWLIQGLRHITGVRDWGPYQQANLVLTLVKKEGCTFKEAGKIIGISPNRASSMLRGLLGLQQMMVDEDYGKEATPDFFSHFEQAYLKIPVRELLQWDEAQGKYTNSKNLRYFYKLITAGNAEIAQGRLKSQEIRDVLPGVLQHSESREMFVEGECNLYEAAALTRNNSEDKKQFAQAANYLLDSLGRCSAMSELDSAEIKTIKRLHEKTSAILGREI